ncbi:MAG TPA: hypothetical protein VMF08_04965 [Candidatus Sulfotelmatobacter sp.]|nr:hypothetical protein [Candidatus Sulfotelmatobacter sp.]
MIAVQMWQWFHCEMAENEIYNGKRLKVPDRMANVVVGLREVQTVHWHLPNSNNPSASLSSLLPLN